MQSRRFPRVCPKENRWPSLLMATGMGIGAGIALHGLSRQLRPPDQSVRRPVRLDYGVDDPQFTRTLSNLLSPPLLGGNDVRTLVNGDEIFPEMLAAIRSAERTITMETFIYWSGRLGRAFAEAFAERARHGVRCHLLLDWLGSQRLDPESIDLMSRAGVHVQRYHRHPWHVARANHRTHRKILIIDGKVGFTGGVGIADQWAGNAEDECQWRDNHYHIRGPVVAQLQAAFIDNWLKADHSVVHDEGYFPHLADAGRLQCQVFRSSADEGSESMRLLYLFGLAAARKTVRIATAYFVPDALSIEALISAAGRGVDVQIIVPGPHIDVEIVRRASRARWGELLEAGVRIFEFMPTMYHTKAMIVDDLWTSIGSTNFDSRSFRLNDEANLNVHDRSFALAQTRWFEHDLARSREITMEQWRHRPHKAIERLASLVGSQL